MNLLYLLGNGSNWQDNELRYSLRSAQQHVSVDQVIVVGERPPWLTGVLHIPAMDIYQRPVACTLHKLLEACTDERVPERFVLMNDDFIFLADQPDPLPTYIRGTVKQYVDGGPRYEAFYYGLMCTALRSWQKLGIAHPLDYDGHWPMPMTKAGVLAMAERFGGSGSVYAWRTYYGNMHGGHTVHAPDPKMYDWYEPRGGTMSLSEDLPTSPAFVRWMAERFPMPSHWEA